ncbi:hypothetical protein PFISCL1PPCAC_324 [Pristionchus fissidentatus]|uniref:Nicotinamide-nucleotide adenylyltransferase n=1 Tax=Pristionchus fissidentatus TaxID=1538716 RepID=A0AAV5US20_9BILA|nr:hypothetical protein PFISCL1PPCAC_324 [Pristionchus fissidentatus]
MGTTRRAVLLSCGSFNPPTLAHLRMMELAREHLQSLPLPYTVVEGIFSPVSSTYVHKPLAADNHRIAMLEKATESSGWMCVNDWETTRGEWTRTKEVLSHHLCSARIRHSDANLACFLVCGGDLVDSFKRLLPDGSKLWADEDVKAIVEQFGIVVINREGSDPSATLASLGHSTARCYTISDVACPNGVSSTLLRAALQEGRSVRYCTPDGVVDYILQHRLYSSCIKPVVNGVGEKTKEQNGAAASVSPSTEKIELSRSFENGDVCANGTP